jgi:hypothetical protein
MIGKDQEAIKWVWSFFVVKLRKPPKKFALAFFWTKSLQGSEFI